MTSEPLDKEDAKAVWRNFEIMRPGSREPAQLLTLGKSPHNTKLGFSANREYGDFAVYNLYNDQEEEQHINLRFEEAGLPADVNTAVFDFWENKVIAYTKGSYNTKPLPYHSSALLRFTPIIGEHAQLLGSDLHLSMGATEIDDIRASNSKIEIDFNSDAGAQNGSLTFYSKKAILIGTSENCKVTSVEDLGEDLWKVNITDRQWGKAQSISLALNE